jgi:hypothetical protein
MSLESDPKPGGEGRAAAKPSAMRLFIFVVLVLVVFNLILFFKLVVAPDKGKNPNSSPGSAETRNP